MSLSSAGTVRATLVIGIVLFFASQAPAQGLGGLGGLGGVGGLPGGLPDRFPPAVNQPLGRVNRTLDTAANNVVRVVDSVGRPAQPGLLESDVNGTRVVKSEVLALSPSAASLAAARALNFQIIRQTTLGGLGLGVTVLRPPQGMSVSDAVAALRMADPQGVYDYNHIYDPSGGVLSGVGSVFRKDSHSPDARDISIGIVDAGIEVSHPALKRADIVIKNFAGKEKSPPAAHGTALASILVGGSDSVKGVLPGARLYVADVYGGKGTGGSADAIAQGLAWLAEKGAAVINISLVGPPNRTLEAVVKALIARGHVVVAAVGNDGPARPVEYPAAYSGVIAVTSVDVDRHIQIDANRGPEIAFAALGVNVSVAALNKTYANATGTSFAAPLVAARFAMLVPRPDPAALLRARQALQAEAVDLGAPGRDDVFGYGYLGIPPGLFLNASATH